MNLDEIRTYFRNIFGGLEYAHKNNIIHRDIKPANFLYNPATGHGALCDFGLAEVFQPQEWHGKCLHSLPCASLNHIHGKLLEEPQALIDQVGCHAAEWQKLTAAQRRGRPPPWMPLSIDEESELEERKECDEDFYENWEPVEMAQHRKGRVGHLKTEADRRCAFVSSCVAAA
jgi:cell division control protein 7